ncbi:hypothetical protein TNCV_2114291, partial [Trichonephila clavipes]
SNEILDRVYPFLLAKRVKQVKSSMKLLKSKMADCNNSRVLRLNQERNHRRINDMGSSRYRGTNMCNYSTTNRVLIPKKEPRRNFDP